MYLFISDMRTLTVKEMRIFLMTHCALTPDDLKVLGRWDLPKIISEYARQRKAKGIEDEFSSK